MTRTDLRHLLQSLLGDDSGVRALILDHFPTLLPKLSQGMSLEDGINLLFTHYDDAKILAALRKNPGWRQQLDGWQRPDDRLAAYYCDFVVRELTTPPPMRLALPKAPIQLQLQFRVDVGDLPRASAWPLASTVHEDELILYCCSVAARPGARLLICGEPGSGKTELLQRIARRMAQAGKELLPLYCPIGAVLKDGLFITRWLEQRLQRFHPQAAGLAQLLGERGAAGQIIFLIDGLDPLLGEAQRDAEIAISSLLDMWPGAVFVIAVRPLTEPLLADLSFRRLEILPLSDAQQRQLLTAQLNESGTPPAEVPSRVDALLREIGGTKNLRELASSCLGLVLIGPLAAQKESLARGPLRLIEQFVRFLLSGRQAPVNQPFPQPDAALAALRFVAYKLTASQRDAVSIAELEQIIHSEEAPRLRAQLERHAPWREGGLRVFLEEQAAKLGLLGPYEHGQNGAPERWKFVHDALRDALAAQELRARFPAPADWPRLSALVDRSAADASAWFEPVTLLVADASPPDELALELHQANPALGLRILQRVPHLDAATVSAIGARGDFMQRARVFSRICEIVEDPQRGIELLDRIRSGTRDGNDLFFIDQALAAAARQFKELSEPVASKRALLFAHIPRPPLSAWSFDTPAGAVPLLREVPAGTVVRAPDSVQPSVRRLRALGPYQLSCAPITRGLFSLFTPGAAAWLPNHPVVSLTWYEAVMYCRWLATLHPSLHGARLPREVEWEYACLYNSEGAALHCGSPTELAKVAWFRGNAEEQLRPVARLQPNALGLYDLHGNVREWCDDLLELDEAERTEELAFAPQRESTAAPTDGWKALRGGCFLDGEDALHTGARTQAAPYVRSELFGFRVLVPGPLADRKDA